MRRIDKYIRWLGKNNLQIKRLLEVAELRPDMIPSIETRFLQMVEEQAGNIIDLPPFTLSRPDRDYGNPFSIGKAVQGHRLGYDYMVDSDSFMQSGVIIGIPGPGKSKLAQVIALGVAKIGGRAIILDNMHEHHPLTTALPPGEVLVLELGKTEKENPLQPPGHLSPQDWIGVLKDIFREQFLRDGATNLMQDIMNRAYQNYGIYDGGRNYPTLKKILSGSLEKVGFRMGTRHYAYAESLTDRLRTLALVPSFDVTEGYDLAEILKSAKIVIFRVGKYSSDIKMFYVNLKLQKIMQCLSENLGKFGWVLTIIEESYEMTSPARRSRSDINEPFVYRAIRQSRRYNNSFLLVDQYAAGIARPIWACLNNIFIMRQSEMGSIAMISQARNLDEEQAEFLSTIPLRYVVHAPSDDEPRLVRVMDLNLPKVSEQQLDSYMEPLLQKLNFIPTDNSTASAVDLPKLASLRKIDKQIVKKLLEHPFYNVQKICKVMGNLSPMIAKGSLKKLEEQGYIESFMANLGMGRPKKLYILAERGANLLGEDYGKVKPKGKGGLLHQAAQRLLSEALAGSDQNILVEYERVDVAQVLDNGKLKAYQIELNPQSGNILNQILNNFKAGFSEVVVLSVNKEALSKVKDRVHSELPKSPGGAHLLSRITFSLLKHYLNLGSTR